MTSLEGKVALVTGASRGVGAAVARALDREGVSLGLASRSGDDLGIEGAVAGPADVRRPADMERIVGETVERFGRLDIVVVNAGVGAYGPFHELDPAFIEEIVDVNVKGALYTVRAALPHILEADEGDIVMIASVAGLRGLPLESGLLRVEVRAGRLHAGARPRAQGSWRPLHERLPGRRRHRLRDGSRPHP